MDDGEGVGNIRQADRALVDRHEKAGRGSINNGSNLSVLKFLVFGIFVFIFRWDSAFGLFVVKRKLVDDTALAFVVLDRIFLECNN